MYILVKHGRNETMVCNPHCMVINLLHSIRQRAGYGANVNVDLSDVSGLVKNLFAHLWDDASAHLSTQAMYVLVERKTVASDDLASDTSSVVSDVTPVPQLVYVPLLDKCDKIFPDFKLRCANDNVKDERDKRPVRAARSGAASSVASSRTSTRSVKRGPSNVSRQSSVNRPSN